MNQITRNMVQDMDKASRAVPGTADDEGTSGGVSGPVVFLNGPVNGLIARLGLDKV